MPRIIPHDQVHSADATQEYRGPIDEVVTDVSVELVLDEGVAGRPLPSFEPQARGPARSLVPLAIDAAPPLPSPPMQRQLPSATPSRCADATSERAIADLEETIFAPREPPRWRFAAFTAAMVAAGLILGLAAGSRARVSDAVPSTMPRPIERKHVELPDPAAALAPTEVVAKVAAPAVPTTGTLLTPKWARGRRVFVDDKEIGVSGKLEAACGAHRVRVGVVGRIRKTTIPCGGEVTVLP